jgi:apoptosis-inducing factor 3
MKEITVAKVTDLKDNEMKSVSVGGKEILLTRVDGNYYALGANCTHYSAPLAEGVLCNGVIMCPWHHACFDAKTGDLKEPPARDSLPRYETIIKGKDVIVKVPDELEFSRTPEMVKYDSSDQRHFIILGGGAAGNACAQALREAGFTGKITMITREDRVPYDRPNLSKAYLSGEAPPEWMPLRGEDFYKDNNIELIFKKKVTEVNTNTKEVVFDDVSKIKYDKILLASGGVPKKLNIPGSDLKNIFYLRSFDDCDKIIEACSDAKKAVVIGAGFIGMEAAHSLRERNLDVTVIAPSSVPLENVFGIEIGNLIKDLHEEHGVRFKLNSKVKSFEGDNKVKFVNLESGGKIEADFVVIGIGVKPATDYIKGLQLQSDGGIKVNEYMEAKEDVFAAGDIAQFHYNDEEVRIEHWRVAEQQGRIAGFNMAGRKTEFNKIPFFWTAQAGLNLRYSGYAKNRDNTITWGDVKSREFITFLIKNNKTVAAIGCNRDAEMDAVELLMSHNKMPSVDLLKNSSLNLTDLVKKI